jgi:NADH-quinone oxidoreductase subunit N
MVYLVLFTNHFFFGNLILGISANSFLSIFLGGLLLNFFSFSDPFYESLNSHISVNSTSLIIKGFMIFSSLVTVLFSFSFLRLKNIKQYEFSLLILFSISGLMFTALSADILAVFMSLELQGLAFYLLATFYSNSEFNTEVGLKYFVLASFSSAILLFGFSLIYVILGSTSFETIQLLSNQHYNSDIIFLSLVFSFSAFLFKVGAAPFHM